MMRPIIDTITRILYDTFRSSIEFASTNGTISDDNFTQSFFRHLKSNVTDDHRRLIREETGTYVANIRYRPAVFGNSSVSIDINIVRNDIDATGRVMPVYFHKFGVECATSVLVYMGFEKICLHTEYGSYVNPIGMLLDFWSKCTDADMIEWFLENDVYTNVPKGVLCDEWITVNVKAQRNEIVMRLLRWKHENLGHNDTPPVRL